MTDKKKSADDTEVQNGEFEFEQVDLEMTEEDQEKFTAEPEETPREELPSDHTISASEPLSDEDFEDLDDLFENSPDEGIPQAKAQKTDDSVADIFEDPDDHNPQELGLEIQEEEEGLDFAEELTLEGQVEAILFASPKPLKPTEVLEIVQDEDNDFKLADIEGILASLHQLYEERAGGFHLYYEKGIGYQFQTIPAASHLMERMFSSRPRPLSRAALETLSIIAYRQPSTRAEIEYVRGVDAGSIIKNLLDRDLIKCVGRKEDAGRPMLFGTTAEFLKVFKLEKIEDLPPLASFQPPAETMESTEFEVPEAVDVEEFVGDEEQAKPQVSEGLAGGNDELDELAAMVVQDESDLEESNNSIESDGLPDVAGPSVENDIEGSVPHTTEGGPMGGATQFDQSSTQMESDDDGNKNTETTISARDSLPEGGVKVDR